MAWSMGTPHIKLPGPKQRQMRAMVISLAVNHPIAGGTNPHCTPQYRPICSRARLSSVRSATALLRRLFSDSRSLSRDFEGVFRLKGQPKRDGSSIVRSCKAIARLSWMRLHVEHLSGFRPRSTLLVGVKSAHRGLYPSAEGPAITGRYDQHSLEQPVEELSGHLKEPVFGAASPARSAGDQCLTALVQTQPAKEVPKVVRQANRDSHPVGHEPMARTGRDPVRVLALL